MPRPSGLPDRRDIYTDYPWVREVWLWAAGATDLLVVCDRPPASVGPGQRRRLLGELQARSDRRLDLRRPARQVAIAEGPLSRRLPQRRAPLPLEEE